MKFHRILSLIFSYCMRCLKNRKQAKREENRCVIAMHVHKMENAHITKCNPEKKNRKHLYENFNLSQWWEEHKTIFSAITSLHINDKKCLEMIQGVLCSMRSLQPLKTAIYLFDTDATRLSMRIWKSCSTFDAVQSPIFGQ